MPRAIQTGYTTGWVLASTNYTTKCALDIPSVWYILFDMDNIFQRIRHHARFDQNELAECLGITQGAITNYECGIRSPTVANAYKYLDFARLRGYYATLEDIYPRPI